MSESKPTVKPGWRTTEFWATVVADIAGLATLSGAFGENDLAGRIIGGVIIILATLGYDAARARTKSG